MKTSVLAAIFLIVLGALALAYQGFTYTTHKKALDIGSVEASKKETHSVPVPPIIGVVALVGGVSLLVVNGRNGS